MNLRAPGLALALSICGLVAGTLCVPANVAAQEVVTVTYGPYVVPAASESGPGNLHLNEQGIEVPCLDGYITSFVPDMVYADGSAANFYTSCMMHHVVFYNTQANDLTCPGIGAERFFASGNERTVMELPEGYGYYNSAGSQWGLNAHLMNMSPEPQELFIELVCTCLPGDDESIKPVVPIWLDVDNCGDSEFSVPSGLSDTHWDWESPFTGTIVRMGGHVHNYGISVSAEHLGTGEYICTSVAGYEAGSTFAPVPVADGDAGHPGSANALDDGTDPPNNPQYMGRIQDMSSCHPFFTIRAGDVIRLHTRYNIPEETFPAGQDDVMGIMLAYMHPGTLRFENTVAFGDSSTAGGDPASLQGVKAFEQVFNQGSGSLDDYLNLAVGGAKSADVKASVADYAQARKDGLLPPATTIMFQIGGNDLLPHANILAGSAPGERRKLDRFIKQIRRNISQSLLQLINCDPDAVFVVWTVPDITLLPALYGSFTPEEVANIRAHIELINSWIRNLERFDYVAVVDVFQIAQDVEANPITLLGQEIAGPPASGNPDNLFADGAHLTAVGNALLANAIILEMNL